jgi:hypothetical protein
MVFEGKEIPDKKKEDYLGFNPLRVLIMLDASSWSLNTLYLGQSRKLSVSQYF